MELVRKKNATTYIAFPIVDADGDTVKNIGASGDNTLQGRYCLFDKSTAPSTFYSLTNDIEEVTGPNTTGIYRVLLTANEVNGEFIYIKIVDSGGSAKDQHILIRTTIGDPILETNSGASAATWRTITTDSAGNVSSNVKEVSDDTTAADTLELFAEALDQITGKIQKGTLENDAIDADVIKDAAITAAKLAADCITNAKIANDTIAVENIKDAAITAAKLAADCITNAKIANDAIAVENIKDAAITAAKLAADCITEAKIADNAIAAEHIADGAIDAGALAASCITGENFDGSTAYPLLSADSGATQIARVGADGDTLETLSGQIDTVPTVGDIQAEIEENGASLLDTIKDNIGTPANIDSGGATLADNLKKIADDNGGADFDATLHSLKTIRERGDSAWSAAATVSEMLQIVPSIPMSIDISSATYRLALYLLNPTDDLPTTAEITPGTITIERKAYGASTWSAVTTDAACSEADGAIYYDEVFDSGTGYTAGDSIRITFKNQKVSVSGNDQEITGGGNGWIFHTEIRRNATTLGEGAITFTYTVHENDEQGDVIPNVEVWVSTDNPATNIVASGVTGDDGSVTFYLDAGTYYLWRTKAGVNFSNPDTETIS